MFAVRLDPRLAEYREEIVYTLEYLFQTLGYSYRILGEDEHQKAGETLLIYVSDLQKIEGYLSGRARGFSIIILHDEFLFNTQKLELKDIKDSIRLFNVGYDVPYISNRTLSEPISRICDTRLKTFYVGLFHFDLIGNLYFHLRGLENSIIKDKDSKGRNCFQHSLLSEYYNSPFLMGMLKLIELFMEEGESYMRSPLLKKGYWPDNKQYAIAITHNVSRLTKWKISRFFLGIADSIKTFWRFKYHWRNFWGLIRYLFCNWEPYWNFDLVSHLERTTGVKSTYFFGVKSENKHDIDYKLQEKDLNTQKEELKEAGHELALLSYYNSINQDDFGERVDSLGSFYGEALEGVRQNHFRNIDWSRSQYYLNGGLKWDSSWSMPDRQGYIHGIGYPFYLTGEKLSQKTVMELPVTYNDNVIGIDKTISGFEGQKTKLDNLIDSARKFKSLLVMNFDVSSFEEIDYLEGIFKWLMERLKGDPTAWKARLTEIYNWVKKREAVSTSVQDNVVEISCREDIEECTLYMKGLWRVEDIESREKQEAVQEELDLFTENTWWQIPGAEVMITGRVIKLRKVEAGSVIRILVEKFA